MNMRIKWTQLTTEEEALVTSLIRVDDSQIDYTRALINGAYTYRASLNGDVIGQGAMLQCVAQSVNEFLYCKEDDLK